MKWLSVSSSGSGGDACGGQFARMRLNGPARK